MKNLRERLLQEKIAIVEAQIKKEGITYSQMLKRIEGNGEIEVENYIKKRLLDMDLMDFCKDFCK